jgi:GntR family transcriptional regulator, histidine utilization repressor
MPKTTHTLSASPNARRAAPSEVARYQQVKDLIARQIQDGTWRAGDRLPSENELVQQLGLSRMTINRALRELTEQGRIRRVAGVGSFVAEDKPQSHLVQITSLAHDIRARGHDYACEMITAERVSASLEVAAALGLGTGDSVFHTVCVHKENGVPIQLEDRFVNPALAANYLEQDFALVQPTDYLVRHIVFDEMEHVVDAVMPSAEQARLLDMPAGQACLLLTRRTWQRGIAVTWVRCWHPGMRYRLGSRFFTNGNASAG